APAEAPPAVVAALPPPLPPEVPRPALPPGAPPWLKNAVPAKMPPAGHPAVVIVIDDLGVDRKRSNRVVQLPGPLTLAWLPYARELPEQARAARARGHELLIHVPMEPSVKADPGPNALLVTLDRPEIAKRLEQAFASFDGYVGINNHMGSRFTADRARMAPVIAELHRRGLLWLDSRTTPNSAGLTLAQEQGVPHLGRDVFLDNEQSVPAIRAELARLESVARKQGWGVAIGHPHDTTIEALASWLPDAQKRGFTLVPVSAVVRARQAGG
ncbi:divergent polysaccharide deacetylase family protein, partial [Azospirillum sp. RWY-5-1]